MTTLTWPAQFVPAGLVWHLEANTGSFVSPLTRAAQTTEIPGARWLADLTLPPQKADSWRAFTAFIARMRGQAGRAYVTPWQAAGSSAPTYTAGLDITVDNAIKKADSSTPRVDETYPVTLGAPVVSGAAQAGGSLITRGWSQACYVFKAGDFFHYDTSAGRTLHMVLDDTVSGGDGTCTLAIEPPIRTAPADGAALTILNPSCVMRLADDQVGAVSLARGAFGTTSLKLIETF